MPIQNMNELRAFVLEEFERLRNNKSTPATANAVANLAGKIVSSINVELEYNRMIGSQPYIPLLNKKASNLLESHEEKPNET